MKSAIDLEQQLVDAIGGFAHDPLGFVQFAYPWGEEGTELAGASGPRDWQRKLLQELGRRLREASELGLLLPILMARSSGHGVGKSTVAAAQHRPVPGVFWGSSGTGGIAPTLMPA